MLAISQAAEVGRFMLVFLLSLVWDRRTVTTFWLLPKIQTHTYESVNPRTYECASKSSAYSSCVSGATDMASAGC